MFTGVTRDKITSGNDLFEVKGTYLTHSFKDNAGFKNFTHQYYIWTKEYSNAFQVKADYLRIFKGQDFITEIRRENILVLSIPKHLEKKLDSPDNVFVTSIESAGRIYLNKDEVLKIEQGLAASNSETTLLGQCISLPECLFISDKDLGNQKAIRPTKYPVTLL